MKTIIVIIFIYNVQEKWKIYEKNVGFMPGIEPAPSTKKASTEPLCHCVSDN